MKTAIIFSGLPRYVAQCYPNILKNILIPNNINPEDIYVHSWLPEPPRPEYQICQNTVGTWEDCRTILDLYRPASSKFDRQPEYQEIVPVDHVHRQYNFVVQAMFDSIQRSANLIPKEKLKSYDVICRCRFDFQMDKTIKFSEFDTSKVNLPAGHDRITDFFAFANAKVMLYGYVNSFDLLKHWFLKTNIFTPEELLENYIKAKYFEIAKHQFGQRIYRET